MNFQELPPVRLDNIDQTFQELETVREFGYIITGRDIPDDLLDIVINSQN